MVTTVRPNKDALSDAIDIYRDAMRPFILHRLRRVPGATVERAINSALGDRRVDEINHKLRQGYGIEDVVDVNDFPHLVQRHWRDVFSNAFGDDRTIQSELWLISRARNQVSHPGAQDLEAEYTGAHLYHIANILGSINAPQQKKAVEDVRAGLNISTPAADDAEVETSKQQTAEQPRSISNLKPWREVIRPNQDVAQGSYQQAEFAADLQQVYDGRADTTQYGNPIDFYDHTYITPGIHTLLVNTLKRLAGKGGDPVIQTKTGFGGGKTHSLIALYHLVRNAGALLNAQTGAGSRVGEEVRAIMQDAGYNEHPDGLGKVAVLDGAYLATTDPETTPNGDPLNTLWGVMAYQLDEQRGYDFIGEAARQGTAPGGRQLDALFDHVGPCVILIDELVAYVRNAGPVQDSIYTFIQALTQSVRRSKDAALVITLPQSRVEAGAEGGADALDRLDSLMGRIEAVWEPLAVNEAFEVVRRRLFDEITDPAARDQTCEAFVRMYSNDRAEYPQGVTERNYLERMKACYPIHPEIFDRLYSDWSSIPGFQRTRGVLRMMADCVSRRLYLSGDPSPLIMPGSLPFSDERLANEFNRLLPGEWGPVLLEVDSDNSRTDNIDRVSQRFFEVGGAARRIARAVFLGSARSGATKGIDSRQVHLGVVQPGHGYARYNEALARMAGDLYYLYHADSRYYFHAEENLNKVASDRTNSLSQRAVDDHIARKLEEARNRRGDVILYTDNTADVPDTDSVRLVVLPPGLSLPTRSSDDDTATPEALKILEQRGDSPRFRRNTLLFLTTKRDEIRGLRDEVKKYLAWDSIINGETRIPSLTGDRQGQARAEVNNADKGVAAALIRAYRWTLRPYQRDPQQASYEFNQAQTEAPSNGEIFRSAFAKFVEDEALVDNISPASLTSMLQQYIWNREGADERISVDDLWNLFTNNVYLHRLRNRDVLERCIGQGVEQGTFGHADSHDGDKYSGLRYRESMTATGMIMETRTTGFLVRPDAAARQKETEKTETPEKTDDNNGYAVNREQGTRTDRLIPDDTIPPEPPVRRTRRIIARKTTGANISLDDINALREEIIRNLSSDGGEITVEIIVSASKPDGFSEAIIRSVRENSIQLGLEFNAEE